MNVTASQYQAECKRRFGSANPERMQVAAWEWMVRRGTNPYLARTELGLDSHMDPNPDWTFERFGMSRTRMRDGRIICIAGEHEDYYDPDFCIYNDVIVLHPVPGESGVTPEAGSVEIYGYPRSVFPPTDFHSATLVDDRIYIIGCLGYAGTREVGRTPVFVLDTKTLTIDAVPTSGDGPGWVYEHHAAFDASSNSITVRAGKVERGEKDRQTPNMGAYRLRLRDFSWELISPQERHRAFVIRRREWRSGASQPSEAMFRINSVPSEPLFPMDRGIPVFGLSVQGVRVTFEVWVNEISGMIEGDLPDELSRRILDDVAQNLTKGTGTEWTVDLSD